MIVLKTAGRSIGRNLTRSITTVLVIAAMAAFLVLYGQNLARARNEMEDTSRTIPVFAEINALKGRDDPSIPVATMETIRQSGFVKAATLKAGLVYDLNGKNPSAKNHLYAVTGPDAERQLKKHLQEMIWAEGWDLEKTMASAEPMVILPLGDGRMPGQQVEVTLRPGAKGSAVPVSMTVAAVYRDDLDDEDLLHNWEGITYAFCSMPWLENQLENGLFPKEHIFYNYARLQMQDVVNINAFKLQMAELGFNSEDTGLQMIIADRLLLSAINPLMKSVSLQQKLFPLLFALIALLGASLCYLTMNARKQEFAIMRSLGVTPATVFVSFLSETLLLCLLGTAVGALLLLTGARGFDLWLLPLFVLCYLAGGAAAIQVLNRPDVLGLLQSRNE